MVSKNNEKKKRGKRTKERKERDVRANLVKVRDYSTEENQVQRKFMKTLQGGARPKSLNEI
jgi:hypothetical protein